MPAVFGFVGVGVPCCLPLWFACLVMSREHAIVEIETLPSEMQPQEVAA